MLCVAAFFIIWRYRKKRLGGGRGGNAGGPGGLEGLGKIEPAAGPNTAGGGAGGSLAVYATYRPSEMDRGPAPGYFEHPTAQRQPDYPAPHESVPKEPDAAGFDALRARHSQLEEEQQILLRMQQIKAEQAQLQLRMSQIGSQPGSPSSY